MSPGRPHLALGESGAPWTTRLPNGRHRAAVYIRTRSGKRRQITATGNSKSATLRILQRKVDAQEEAPDDGAQPNWTVRELAEYWEEHKRRSGNARRRAPLTPQTRGNYHDHLTRVVVPAMGHLRLHEITVPRLESHLNDLEDSGVSTTGPRQVMNMMFKLAARDGALLSNPLTYIPSPPREDREVEALEIEQARLLLEAVHPDRLRKPGQRGPNRDLLDFCLLALATGARISEVLAVQRRLVAWRATFPPSPSREPSSNRARGSSRSTTARRPPRPVTSGPWSCPSPPSRSCAAVLRPPASPVRTTRSWPAATEPDSGPPISAPGSGPPLLTSLI